MKSILIYGIWKTPKREAKFNYKLAVENYHVFKL